MISPRITARMGFLMWLTIIIVVLLPTAIANSGGLSWSKRFGKLRAEALEKLFPGVLEYAEIVDRFAIGYVDYRDPLESIIWITMYLPGVVFMTAVIFFCIPHVLNLLILLPKMWFFSIPCLYRFKHSVLRRRRSMMDGDGVMGECDGDLAHITGQVYNSLLKISNVEIPQKSQQIF